MYDDGDAASTTKSGDLQKTNETRLLMFAAKIALENKLCESFREHGNAVQERVNLPLGD
jgi:hypothetical protein